MQHPNRDGLESAFATKLKGLNASLKRELAKLVGRPPNFRNVPASFWQRVEAEMRAEIIAALYLIHLENGLWHAEEAGEDTPRPGTDLFGAFDDAATGYAETAAGSVAGGAAAKAAERWINKTRELEIEQAAHDAAVAAGDENPPAAPTAAEIAQAIDETLPDSQADNIARTETTKAQTAGGDVGIGLTVGTSDEDTWSVRPELSRTGPCGNCRRCDGVRRADWATISLQDGDGHVGDPTEGPPLGPGCCCEVVYAGVKQRAA